MTTSSALSVRIREATAAEHRAAETRGFITRLMDGEFDLATYTRYLVQYAHVYRALESRPARPGDPALINDSRLDRYPSIASDLKHLGAADWDSHGATDATRAYCAHLEAIPEDDIPRYLAHHYTRYLGDLSGGQAIGTLMSRHYGATADQLSFYRFEQIPAAPRFKNEYRAALDALDFTPEQEQSFVDESLVAFRLNGAIFDELGETQPSPASGP
ncbi:heme oxygenase (biliverdin-producing) [Demequina sp. SO4-18]|uniref:biliverdin-producing heme oxygenase n=1 Tax=Demequina sp. SO4-18 TaxID=3401026 RepID=UPI003B5BB442